MSRKKQRKARREEGFNTHHLLHYRRFWSSGYKQHLRRVFVYELPVEVHERLHAEVGPVPPLDEEDARWLWIQYNKEGHTKMDLFEALSWLHMRAPSSEFAIAIVAQAEFLRKNLERSD